MLRFLVVDSYRVGSGLHPDCIRPLAVVPESPIMRTSFIDGADGHSAVAHRCIDALLDNKSSDSLGGARSTKSNDGDAGLAGEDNASSDARLGGDAAANSPHSFFGSMPSAHQFAVAQLAADVLNCSTLSDTMEISL